MVRFAALALCLVLAAVPAFAAEHEPKKADPDAGSTAEMPYLIAPIVVDDKLVAYAYVSSKIIAVSPRAMIDVRLKTAFIQDAFVRDVNARPIGRPDDPATVDEPALKARLLADVKRVVGAAKIRGFEFIQIQVTRLRPAPQARTAAE